MRRHPPTGTDDGFGLLDSSQRQHLGISELALEPASLSFTVSVSGKRICGPWRKFGRRRPQSERRRLLETKRRTHPRQFGLFRIAFRKSPLVRDCLVGPERTRTTCQPRSHIELVSEKARTAKLVGLEPVSGSTT